MKIRLTVFLFLLTLCSARLSARQNISIEDVLKIELFNTPGGFFNDRSRYLRYEVVKENGNWISNQLLQPSGKAFIANISTEKIDELLKFISATDTSIHFEQFKLNDAEMTSAFDSLNNKEYLKFTGITEKQRALFLKKFSNDDLPGRFMEKLLDPGLFADRTRYTIRLTTKDGGVKTIQALWGNFYNLPWDVDGKPIYNPEISRLFAELTGDTRFDKEAKSTMYQTLMIYYFGKNFQSPFALENFKKNYPADYKKLGRSLKIIKASNTMRGWFFLLTSSELPDQMVIDVRFHHPDLIVPKIKPAEARLKNVYHDNNYFFKYLKENPHQGATIMLKEIYNEDDSDMWLLKNIKRKYIPVAALKILDVIIMEVYSKGEGRHKGDAKWMLLPDDSLICIPYEGDYGNPGSTAFVYDKKGKLLEEILNIHS